MFKVIVPVAILLSNLSAFAHASEPCVNAKSVSILKGVAVNKAAYVDPDDFAWAPKNGFVAYPAIVTSDLICATVDGKPVRTHVLQIVGLASTPDLKDGLTVKLHGSVIPAHTAHHFETLLFSVN